MKNENIPAEVKSKSLKEAKDEIYEILKRQLCLMSYFNFI